MNKGIRKSLNMRNNPAVAIITAIDQFNEKLGRGVSWVSFALVVATFLVVLLRYIFNTGIIALQEILLYMHSIIFMLGASYTLRHDAHVRVDVFYRPLGAKGKAIINLLGILLILFPFCGFIFYISWEYVSSSWSYREGSREAGGLDAVFILKSLIIIMPVMLFVQGVAELLRSLLVLLGKEPPSVDHLGVEL